MRVMGKMKKVKCDICGKEFKAPQGLKGHMAGVHGIIERKDLVVVLEKLEENRMILNKILKKIEEHEKSIEKHIFEEHIGYREHIE
jgi:hypothetical protein